MNAFFQTMSLPFLACLLLAGIHVYLGIHVLARKVIFVDLALAQIAALGAIYGILLGYTPLDHPWIIKGFSLVFTVIGAIVFSLTKQRQERVPHEALIGITYAAALSMTILASSHLAHGADEFRELLSGSILWVEMDTIIFSALLYAAIGIFHFIFRHQFLSISFHPDSKLTQGLRVRFWDFLFYLGFGFVVTSSVAIAGVLLVFCYLVIPAVIATLLADKFLPRLCIGWLVGALVSFLGVWISYVQDLPSGPTIVVCFVAFLIIVATVLFVLRSQSSIKRLMQVLVITGFVVVLGALSTFLRIEEGHSIPLALKSSVKTERMLAIQEIGRNPELFVSFKPQLQLLLQDSDQDIRLEVLRIFSKNESFESLPFFHEALKDSTDTIREMAVRYVRKIGSQQSLQPLLQAIDGEHDEYIKVEMAEGVLELGSIQGIPPLIEIIEHGETALVKRDAYEHLTAHVDVPKGTDLSRWWEKNHHNLKWQASTKKFVLKS